MSLLVVAPVVASARSLSLTGCSGRGFAYRLSLSWTPVPPAAHKGQASTRGASRAAVERNDAKSLTSEVKMLWPIHSATA